MISEQSQIPEEEARARARQMIELLRLPLSLMPEQDLERSLAVMRQAFLEPKVLEDKLVAQIMSNTTVEQFAKDSALLDQMLRAPRRVFSEFAKELPRGAAGRTRQATGTDQELAQFAAWLLPVIQVLVRERIRPTKRSLDETIKYLEADFPEQAQYLLQHFESVEAAFSDAKLLQRKALDGRSKTIAYVLTGNKFGMNRSYALRQVRAAIHRHQKPRT